MSYKALLFCPDDKTARVVTQVLTELDFQVEPCNETFAAVKKLTAEHVDAVVVDCENEQNATLLFRSARNSAFNQTSLLVAVVEGQSGVAKAFRIGANLVLTKPINVEQSKGTLRVARGLLRKTDTRPIPSQATSSATEHRAEPAISPPPQALRPRPLPATIETPPTHAVASSSIIEKQADPAPAPEPAEAALLESMPDAALRKHRAPEAPAAKESPWQSVSQSAFGQPPASLLHAEEAATKSGASHDKAPVVEIGTSSHAAHSGAFGAAAAPARETQFSTPAKHVEPPSFSTLSGAHHKEPPAGSSRKVPFIATMAIIALAAAGYFYWTKVHARGARQLAGQSVIPATQPVQPQAPSSATPESSSTGYQQPVVIPPNGKPEPPSAEELAAAIPVAHETAHPANSTLTSNPPATEKTTAASKSANPPAAEKATSTSKPASAKSAPAASEKAATTAHVEQPLIVKNDSAKPETQTVASEDAPQPPAPGVLDVGSSGSNPDLSSIVETTPTVIPKEPHAVKLSQGVSQGMLVKKVAPIYPMRARQLRIEGEVEVLATIGKDGSITHAKVISGPSTLTQATIDAVKQWKYKPYFLDGQPVEVQTQITVNFKLP